MRGGNPWYDPSRPHHTPHGFRNPPGNPAWHRPTPGVAAAWANFVTDLWRNRNRREALGRDHCLSESDVFTGLQRATGDCALTWLGHACFLIRLGEHRVLTDPFLSDYASPVPTATTRRQVPPALRVNQLPRIDTILVSHNHYDHFDRDSLRALAGRFPSARVLVPLGLGGLARACGFERVTELDWYQSLACEALEVAALPAIHMSRRGLLDQNRTLWCGFSIRGAGRCIYFAGDTAWGPVFREVSAFLGAVDTALVPIGAYEPRRLMHCVHATPEEALHIAETLGAREVIGMHWGTIRLTTEPMDEPPRRFMAARTSLRRRLMAVGETHAGC